MRLLLDECVAHDLKHDLVGHVVTTVVEAGYAGLRNGELLRTAAGQYDVLITIDRNLPNQQNIGSLSIAVIVVEARGITYPQVKQLAPSILQTLETIQPGQTVRISKK